MYFAGYPNKLSFRPGETVHVMMNLPDSDRAGTKSEIVRLICADTRSTGAGFQEIPCQWQQSNTPLQPYEKWQTHCNPGSYAYVDSMPVLSGSWSMGLFFQPTLLESSQTQTLIDMIGGEISVVIQSGSLVVLKKGGDDPADFPNDNDESQAGFIKQESGTVSGGELPLTQSHWHWLFLGMQEGILQVHLKLLARHPGEKERNYSQVISVDSNLQATTSGLVLAGKCVFYDRGRKSIGLVEQCFNGRMELPWISNSKLEVSEAEILSTNPEYLSQDDRISAVWDFSREMSTNRMLDISGNDRHGVFVNHPTRAVRGVHWDCSVQDWQRAPQHYGAVHFHEDDLTDAGWQSCFSWRIPSDVKSGIYAAKLRLNEMVDYVTFFIQPKHNETVRGKEKSVKAVLLIPTATYLAYANNRFELYAAEIQKSTIRPKDACLRDHPELGWSLYDRHADGSGVHYSSGLRPILDLKPHDHPWGFTADTNITAWLDHQGIECDVITDEDLHLKGADLLSPYRVVLTGTHPEYVSTRMMDSLNEYLSSGGRLMYMGGNGFYWRIAFDPANPAVIELRRAEGRGLAWDSQPGEYYHSFNGEYGGLWRNIGRPPNQLLGVGFIALAEEGGTGYQRTEGSGSKRARFIFEGTSEGAEFGFYGSICNGSVSQEIDRWNPFRGSPDHALVVAHSVRHPADFIMTREELVAPFPPGESNKLRADMTFFETPSGGAVFSTGSIGFAGALSHNQYENDICRIATNVIQRFLDPTPFMIPGADSFEQDIQHECD